MSYLVLCFTASLSSFQVMQMFKGCRREDTAPHIYSMAQAAYRNLLTTRQDQSIVLLGKSGCGKTTNCQHIIQYLLTIAGSTNKTFSSRLGKDPNSKGNVNMVLYKVVVNVFNPPNDFIFFVVCSREMAGGLHSVGGIWECLYLYEWECQSLLSHCFLGL